MLNIYAFYILHSIFLYYAHGLQLSVIKVLYNLNFSEPESCEEDPSNEDCDEYDDDENDIQFTDGLMIYSQWFIPGNWWKYYDM